MWFHVVSCGFIFKSCPSTLARAILHSGSTSPKTVHISCSPAMLTKHSTHAHCTRAHTASTIDRHHNPSYYDPGTFYLSRVPSVCKSCVLYCGSARKPERSRWTEVQVRERVILAHSLLARSLSAALSSGRLGARRFSRRRHPRRSDFRRPESCAHAFTQT